MTGCATTVGDAGYTKRSGALVLTGRMSPFLARRSTLAGGGGPRSKVLHGICAGRRRLQQLCPGCGTRVAEIRSERRLSSGEARLDVRRRAFKRQRAPG